MIDLTNIVQVMPITYLLSHWEISNITNPLKQGIPIYIIPGIVLDNDDENWLKFGFSIPCAVLENHGECALVLFRTVGASKEVLFSEFWVKTQHLDDSLFCPTT